MFLHPVDCLAGRARMRAQETRQAGQFTTLMQVIVLPLAYRCRQRLSRWLYQRWPAVAGKGRSALSPAQPLPARKAKILLAVLYITKPPWTMDVLLTNYIPSSCFQCLALHNFNLLTPETIDCQFDRIFKSNLWVCFYLTKKYLIEIPRLFP